MGRVIVIDRKSQTEKKVDSATAIRMVEGPRYVAILSGEHVSRKELIQNVNMYNAINALYGW